MEVQLCPTARPMSYPAVSQVVDLHLATASRTVPSSLLHLIVRSLFCCKATNSLGRSNVTLHKLVALLASTSATEGQDMMPRRRSRRSGGWAAMP